jgi:hypothetical protein
VADDVPHDVEVHGGVGVDQDVAQAGDLDPLDIGRLRARLRGQLLDGLADDLEVPNDRVDGLRVAAKAFAGESTHVQADALGGRQDVFEIDPRVARHGQLPPGCPGAGAP